MVSLFTSCIQDPCEGIFCNANGECINGTCKCVDGFSGNECEDTFSEVLSGTYSVYSTCTDSIYLSEIEEHDKSESNNSISIVNPILGLDGIEFLAEVLTLDDLHIQTNIDTIENEQNGTLTIYEVAGDAWRDEFNGNINWEIEYTINENKFNCTELFIKTNN